MNRILTCLGLALVTLAAARPAAAQRPTQESLQALTQDPSALLDTVRSYLAMVEQMKTITSDPLATLIVIQQDMREVYEKKGQPTGVVAELRKTLDGLTDPSARTAVRLAIADVHKSAGELDLCLAELRAIVEENKARLNAR